MSIAHPERLLMVRQALRLVTAIDAAGDNGLGWRNVAEVLEVGRRTAYRWMEAIDGDREIPYELRPDPSAERVNFRRGTHPKRLVRMQSRRNLK